MALCFWTSLGGIQNRLWKQGYWSWNTWGHQLPPLLGLCFSHYISIGIFPASTHAMERLVERNLDRNSRDQNMAIMTDSQAAIRALGSPKINSIKMVWELQSKLNDLGRKHKLPSCGEMKKQTNWPGKEQPLHLLTPTLSMLGRHVLQIHCVNTYIILNHSFNPLYLPLVYL